VFAHLLIPLDGSGFAESVLPVAQVLARRFHSTVTLLHVIERRPPAEVHGERHLASVPEAEAYLQAIAAKSFPDLRINFHVHGPDAGDVASIITRHAEEFGIDLIALCTHGRGGARELLYGSVAQQVLGGGEVPVLLIRPEGIGQAFTCARLLVPLDGSPASEAALPEAETLASAFGGQLHLLTVVPTLATVPTDRAPAALLLPGATAASLEIEEQATRTYLEGLIQRLGAAGAAAELEVCRGDPAFVVIEAADRIGADLIVMATHGRSGMGAVWAGSVATRIVARGRRPMLLVRSPGSPQTP
jgi:nucleotide-binding universal stress UspA family protein